MELLFLPFMILAFAVGIGFFVFWIWAFIKVLQHSDDQGYRNGNQLIWVLVLLSS